ncbi:uncharacterized protein LOC125468980 [Pyrus x bretschneideri]|uniref:uncharacterized protein LOC125468980 n=1 Tax=Pyrus x bretschneideri TaxID=225117 RepID=UPI00202F317E|nr:uncharacterized protein LOC125468980 [Pyrus x bretschneideri]
MKRLHRLYSPSDENTESQQSFVERRHEFPVIVSLFLHLGKASSLSWTNLNPFLQKQLNILNCEIIYRKVLKGGYSGDEYSEHSGQVDRIFTTCKSRDKNI